ncbi:purine-cytosine permease family protein [Sciscionella marina]|uniref:purine-cytosine permease family protein n=1 Tax=Sciscionella marina TaxID=508770 RepID=UPI0003675F92|nr:cytosine permease [Sciscionella marina]
MRVTEIEVHGVEPIPEAERTSRPWDLFRLSFGGANTFATIILGTLPITYGLGFGAALGATVAGVLVGALILAPMSLFGPANHTNNAVSSGAHFGVVGRCVGSFLSLLTAIAFFSISVWVSGDAVTGAVRRLAGVDGGNLVRAIAYGLIAIATFVVCIYGYRFMLLVNKLAVLACTVLMLLGILAYAGDFHAGATGHGGYALGGFWPTWVLAALTAMANPISFGAFLGDWSRYIPASAPKTRVLAAPFFAQLCTMLPFGFGVATATLVPDPNDYIAGLTAISPLWYAIPLILVALIGGLSTGTTALYGTGLDFSSIFPKLSRVRATALIGSLSVVFVFLGSFVFNVVASINAFVTLIVLCTSPWMVIMMTGYWLRRGHYLPDDLQVFNRGQTGGAYWFSHGVNWRAMAAWIPATTAGLLTANTPLIIGPLAGIAGGVDISLVVTLVFAAVLYLLLVWTFPEPRGVYGSAGPRLIPAAATEIRPITATGRPDSLRRRVS